MGHFDLDKHVENLTEEGVLRYLETAGAKITKGDFEGFIDFLKQDGICAQYICASPPENAKLFLKKLLGCFGLAELNMEEVYELIKDNAGIMITRVSEWNMSEIDLLNNISMDMKIKCCTAGFRDINKWDSYESGPETYKILHNNKRILWVENSDRNPDIFVLNNEKIYGIEYQHKMLTIYKNLLNTFCDFVTDTDTELDKIIFAYEREKANIEKIEINLTPCFYKGFFYKGNLFFDGMTGGKISQMKSIGFDGKSLKIEIENLTYPHCGYILLDIENDKITEAYPTVKGQGGIIKA